MSSFKIFDIAGSGLSAQSVRLNTVASNLANADSVSGDPSTVYKARHPVFETVKAAIAAQALNPGNGVSFNGANMEAGNAAVRVRGIVESTALPSERYEPGNPLANADGNVYSPNVNVIEEMTDMISASRAYQNNVEVMNTSKELMLATLKLGS
jgi:flagellar basal-body rod protein FlgC